MMNIILAVVLGALFGFALYFVGAANPRKLLSMLRLENLALMKIIVFAIGFASVLLAISLGLEIFDLTHLSIKSTNLGVIIGGLLFGIGFGSVGTCPGTCVAATGTDGVKRALWAVCGGLVGAFLFSVTFGYWERLGLFRTLDYGKLTLFHISDAFPSIFSFGWLGLMIVGLLFMLVAFLLPAQGRTVN